MNYVLEEFRTERYDATSKARRDINCFAVNNLGFKPVGKLSGDKKTFGLYFDIIRSLYNILCLKASDTLLVQCPVELLGPIIKLKKIRKFKLIYLIHDIFFIKFSGSHIAEHRSEIEKYGKYLEHCNYVIAHNEIMIEKLKNLNINCNFHNLEIFDYYTKCAIKNRVFNVEKQTIAFAGSLGRNPFLQKLDEKDHSFDMFVYGNPPIGFKHFYYKGSVDGNILPEVIEGNYGLLWADDYEQTEENNYMMYNNPHKMSLYIVACMPIISWSKYAAASFIKTNNIGICINSLDELEDALSKVTTDDYYEMVNNCKKLRMKLINGVHFTQVVKEILENV